MKNYSELSDFEINKAVAIASGFKIKEYPSDGSPLIWHWVKNEDGNEFFDFIDYKDFCNNPSDAWSIIVEEKISIMFDNTLPEYEGEYYEWCSAISSCQKYGIQYQSNPLRAAMIAYLMMKDNKNA